MIHVDETDPVGEVDAPFPHRDITIKRGTDAKEHYDFISEIGRGKFGTVFECCERATGLRLAAKVVGVARREERRSVEREVDVMRRLRHPRLIQLYDAYDAGKVMCVVLELITGGELFERVIDDDFILTEKACTVFMRQICEGIEFVHQQNILHLDMKPENILCLTKTGNRIKIIDFGLARFYDPDKKLQVLFGTPEFVAPEVVNFDQIGFGTDMWSIGVICYVLLSGLSPFMGETDIETMANVTVAKYDFDDEAFNEISEDAKDFIRKLLVKDKQYRLSASECSQHKWLIRPASPTTSHKPNVEAKKANPTIVQNGKPIQDELDVAKDNLRLFVERWSEHPNSPYVFDVAHHEIIPCALNGLDLADGQHSVGGCSPSPRSSLSSSPDVVLESEEATQQGQDDERLLSPRGKGLERRASDSSCFLHKRADVVVRVNLAEEIKKLSDHLYMLSTMNTDLANNNTDTEINKNHIESSTQSSSNETKLLPNGYHKTSESSSSKTVIKNGGCVSNNISKQSNVSISKSLHQVNSSFLQPKENTCVTSNMPWAKTSRAKFRITNMNRDVPLPPNKKGSGFTDEFNRRRDTLNNNITSSESRTTTYSRPYYKKTDENGVVKSDAHRTKDLLLHLLDQWDESQDAPRQTSRHKSMSVEWTEGESLAQKSISSVNTFFKRQTSTAESIKKKHEKVTVNGIK